MQAGINVMTMYCSKYAPWEHYPKTLRHSEIQDPLSVIADFFNTGSVKSHSQDLKKWRDCVISDRYFNDKRHGPGTLLFSYDLNLRLLEAAYLLLLAYQENSWKYKKLEKSQLAEERATWVYFPNGLSTEELLNPYTVFRKIFKKIKPQMYRDYLQQWLHAALYTSPIDETMMPGEVIAVYENMLKLYAASWLICQRENEPMVKTRKNGNREVSSEAVGDEAGLTPQIAIKPLGPKLTPGERLGLNELVKLIVKEVPAVQMIVYLGIYAEPLTYCLLILTTGQDKLTEHELTNKIEDKCRPLASVLAFVHKTRSAVHGLTNGSRFWNDAMAKGITAYKTPDLELLMPSNLPNEVLHTRRTDNWQRWGRQGQEFLKGARFYMNNNNDQLAVFILHQAVESSLIGIIKVLCGYKPSVHNF
ncbi:hypothetical protein [Mucilaginibacter pocheonensis]|uniref:HEPN domain-containing protein n=1 Tax=Mucilaginibacter pocheonensis TaxID=398050 RepID=A0ABU1TCB8_9SPHI|nr:hypothetical protein [Mucilaginibacter pocheonensis]MDR6942959.1 hypothetical protein [Mucilaginibacter pocheonensis]